VAVRDQPARQRQTADSGTCDEVGALRTMRTPFGLNDLGAIHMLRAVAPTDSRLPGLLEEYTQRWRKDPRPITDRDKIQAWRAEAGLPPAQDLPDYWHVAMSPGWVEQYGWPGAAFKIGLESEFYLADGTKTTVPPPDWPRR
jgi:hypothetical protein